MRIEFIGPLSPEELRRAPVRMFWLFGLTTEERQALTAQAARDEKASQLRTRIKRFELANG